MPGLLIKQFVKDDLKQLGTDYIDLMLIHSPIGIDCDGSVGGPRGDAGRGVLRSIGVSNFNANQLARLQKTAKVPMQSIRSYSVFSHDESTIAACRATNVTVQTDCQSRASAVTPYSPTRPSEPSRPVTMSAHRRCSALDHAAR